MLQNKTVLNVWFVEDIKHKNYEAKKCCHWHSKIKKNNYKAEYIKLNLVQSFLTEFLLLVITHIWTSNC